MKIQIEINGTENENIQMLISSLFQRLEKLAFEDPATMHKNDLFVELYEAIKNHK